MGHIHPLQLLLLALLAAVALGAGLAKRLAISYPVLLVIVGFLCSLLPRLPQVPLSPDVVFFVFLPPLLYAAAWQTSWREFRFNLVSIAMLAIGLVAFTAVGVALTAHFFMPGFDWRLGFLLGAIVSPTDAPAATSIARRIGMPGTLVDVLEGESLVNDATGLLALQFGLGLIVNRTTPPVGRSIAEFLWLLGGGVLIGLAVGWVVSAMERWVEEGPIEIALSIIVAYTAYLAGEAAHASGVISVVTTGLFLSRRSGALFSPQSRLQLIGVWDALEFLLTGLVFLLIGLQLPYVLAEIGSHSLPRLSLYGLTFSALLIALRLLWTFPAARFSHLVRTKLLHQDYAMPQPRFLFLLGWTGMRGVVALAAAVSLPLTIADGSPFPQRNLIIFLTFSVILVTLVLQGLTLPAVVRSLHLEEDRGPAGEESEARGIVLQAAIDYLGSLQSQPPGGDGTASPVIRTLLARFRFRMEELRASDSEADVDDSEQPGRRRNSRDVLLQTYRKQQEALNGLRGEGRIGDRVYRTLQRELDLGESQLGAQK